MPKFLKNPLIYYYRGVHYLVVTLYKILEVFEGYLYREMGTILQPYFEYLARCKLVHEKIPSKDPKEIEAYVKRLNDTMNFSDENIIRVEDLEPNEIKKFHKKNFMNQGRE